MRRFIMGASLRPICQIDRGTRHSKGMSRAQVRAVVLALIVVVTVSWSPESGLAQDMAAAAPGSASPLTVVSLNLEMREDVGRIVNGIREIGADAADVLVLQEVVQVEGAPDIGSQIAGSLGLDAAYQSSFKIDGGRNVGLATLSRFPIAHSRALPLKRFSLIFRSRERSALAVTLDTPSGPLTTYNVHLDTRINGGDRVDQVADIVKDMEAAPGRALVAGDFNTNENLWLFHTIPLPFLGRQGSGLERYMASHGLRSAFERGATHDTLRMRLDWMFLRDLQPIARAIHPMDISDHHALVVTMR